MRLSSFVNYITRYSSVVAVAVAAVLVPIFPGYETHAQLQINSPSASGIVVPSPSDFATEVLNQSWEMRSISDTANYVAAADYQGSIFNFSDGLLNIAGPSSYFYLLSPGFCPSNPIGRTGIFYPIDTTKYRYLLVRMYSERPSTLRVLVNFSCNYFENYWVTATVPTFAQWKTYVIDLQTISKSSVVGTAPNWGSANATGLRIDPATDGASTLVDWVRLVGAPPDESHELDYSFSPVGSARYSIFLDDNQNMTDGVIKELVTDRASTEPVSINGHHLRPGAYYVGGIEAHDFASLHLDPWDMSNSNDAILPAGMTANFSGGILSGTASPGLNYFLLNNFNTNFEASTFRFLQFKMGTSSIAAVAVIFYNNLSQVVGTKYITVTPGMNTYQLDMNTVSGWSGTISRIQFGFDPGISFNVDEIAIRTDGFGPPEPTPTTRWAPAPIEVNHPPTLTILQPDELGGEDFASTVLQDPWNMDTLSDIGFKANQQNARFLLNNNVSLQQGDYYEATSINNDFDPYQLSLNTTDSVKMADTSRYKNLTFRVLIDRPQDINLGSVFRLVWHSDQEPQDRYFNSDDIISFDGWNTYAMDMTKVKLEVEEHPPGSYPSNPWYGRVNLLRVDPHEFSTPTAFYYDWIRLTADDEANEKFAFTFEVSDLDTPLSQLLVSFYLNNTQSTVGGTLLGTVSGDSARTLVWDASATPDGTYYVFAEVSDGINSYRRLATGRLVVDKARAADTLAPIFEVANPVAGATVYDTLNVAGYALDNLQLATIEARVDGQLIGSFGTGLFNPAARNLAPKFAESSNAGFFSTLSLSGVSAGARTLELKAIDTAGNHTFRSISVFKAPGTDPNPYPTPTPVQEDAISVPVGPEPTPPPTLRLSATLSSKGALSARVTGGESCSSIQLIGATNLADAREFKGSALAIKDKPAAATITFKASRLRGVTKKGSKIFVAAACSGTVRSSTRALNIHAPVPRQRRTSSAWLTYLRSRTK